MTYMISGVDYENKVYHFLVEKDRVLSRRETDQSLKVIKINGQSFCIEPGQVFYDSTLLELSSHSEKKHRYISLQKKGVTTIVVCIEVTNARNMEIFLKKAIHDLINSSLDYIIGITVKVKDLTPHLIRQAKVLRIPFIKVQLDPLSYPTVIAWEWLRDELYRSSPCIIPEWINSENLPRKIEKYNDLWEKFASSMALPTTIPFNEGALNRLQLKAIGAYPRKGTLNNGSDLDYNLFYRNQGSIVEDESNSLYHKDIPNIVVLRGELMKVDETVFYRPGYGRDVKEIFPHRFI